MNLRHIPSRKASKRGYQILFVLALVVLSGLFSTCSGCDSPAEPETLEFNYPKIEGTVNSPLGNIKPEWTGTPEAGTTYAAVPELPKGLSLASDTGVISGTPEAIVDAGQYTITATFPNGGTRSVEISLTIGKSPDTLPDAPANVAAVPGDGEITVTWEDPAATGIFGGEKVPITGFKIYYSENSIDTAQDTPIDFTDLTQDRSVTIPGLTNETSYNIAVSTVTGAGEGELSAAVTAVPKALSDGPTELSIVSYGETEIELTWKEPADSITKYRVYYSKTPNIDTTTADFAETQDGSTAALSVTSLDSGIPYYFKVTAFSDAGESAASSEVEAYTNGVPGEPSNIKAATTAVGKITVTWNEPSPGYYNGSVASVSYKVYHKTDSLAEADLPSLTPEDVNTGLMHVLTNLQADSTYFVTVVAYNDIGDSTVPPSVEATALGADRAPGAPTSVTIASSTETGIELSWMPPTDMGIINGDGTPGTIIGYEVYYSKTAGFTIGAGIDSKTTGNTNSFSLTTLDSGTRYYFKVTAANESGSSAASAEVDGYTTSRPGAPTIAAADPGTTANDEVTLSWDAPGDTGIKDSTGAADTITAYRFTIQLHQLPM